MGKKSALKETSNLRAVARGHGKVAATGKKKTPASLTEEQLKKIAQRRKITQALLEKQKSLEKEKKKKEKEKEKEKKAGYTAVIENLLAKKEKTKKKDKQKPEDQKKKEKKEEKKKKESEVILPASWAKVEGYVPPELEKAADRVLDHYDLTLDRL